MANGPRIRCAASVGRIGRRPVRRYVGGRRVRAAAWLGCSGAQRPLARQEGHARWQLAGTTDPSPRRIRERLPGDAARMGGPRDGLAGRREHSAVPACRPAARRGSAGPGGGAVWARRAYAEGLGRGTLRTQERREAQAGAPRFATGIGTWPTAPRAQTASAGARHTRLKPTRSPGECLI